MSVGVGDLAGFAHVILQILKKDWGNGSINESEEVIYEYPDKLKMRAAGATKHVSNQMKATNTLTCQETADDKFSTMRR